MSDAFGNVRKMLLAICLFSKINPYAHSRFMKEIIWLA